MDARVRWTSCPGSAYLRAMQNSPADDPLGAAIAARGGRVRRVRYRTNRTVLLSVSRDGRTLNSHSCFRCAPPQIIEAVLTFLHARKGSAPHRRALATLKGWEGARRGLAEARASRPRRRPSSTQATSAEAGRIRLLYDELNEQHFQGELPVPRLRVSRRMTRSLGTISYTGAGGGDGERGVREIALSADLLRERNARVLEETLLHEMAHAEAWLRHGHRGHGRIWRAIARRVGCTPRARTRQSVRRTRT